MTLSLNCKDAVDPVCTYAIYRDIKEALANAKKHGIGVTDFQSQHSLYNTVHMRYYI
jgi:hypothetical protein